MLGVQYRYIDTEPLFHRKFPTQIELLSRPKPLKQLHKFSRAVLLEMKLWRRHTQLENLKYENRNHTNLLRRCSYERAMSNIRVKVKKVCKNEEVKKSKLNVSLKKRK